jgi:ferritin-like protein
LHLDLRKVIDLPEKLSFKTKCKYSFLREETPYETKVCEKTKNPGFDYKGTHDVKIDDELIQQLMYNSLTISVWGMIESKRKEIIKLQQEELEDHEENIAKQRSAQTVGETKDMQARD